jgi:membrane-associated phospholipid phosphatase
MGVRARGNAHSTHYGDTSVLVETYDRHAVEWFSSRDWPVVTPVMKGLSDIGAHGAVWIVIGVLVAVWLRRPLLAVAVLAAEEISSVADGVLKNAIGRERPPLADPRVHALIPLPHDPSMPSGHAMMAFAGAALLTLVAPRFGWAFVALAAAIAVSRVYLGVHFPSDVVVGAAIGAIIGALAYCALQLLEPRGRAAVARLYGRVVE